jgi:hypothetical protein
MRVLQVQLENQDFDRLAALAAKSGKAAEDLATEAILLWAKAREADLREGEETLKRRLIKLRVQSKDRSLAAIAQELGLPEDVVTRWDLAMRASPAEWSKAFVYASKSTDPLVWEMTLRDRFYDLWGHRPGS